MQKCKRLQNKKLSNVILQDMKRITAVVEKMEDVADDFETEESLGDVFKAATIYVRQNGAKFDADKLLYFYARYKQVCFLSI